MTLTIVLIYCCYSPMKKNSQQSSCLALENAIKQILREVREINQEIPKTPSSWYSMNIGRMARSKSYKEKFSELFRSLYELCQEENYYWDYCPFVVYQNTLETRLNEYLAKNDLSALQFYKKEK